jgi:pilus assembly protein Flp/PilA
MQNLFSAQSRMADTCCRNAHQCFGIAKRGALVLEVAPSHHRAFTYYRPADFDERNRRRAASLTDRLMWQGKLSPIVSPLVPNFERIRDEVVSNYLKNRESPMCVTSTLRHFLRDENGATAVEYGLLTALIALAIMITLSALGANLASTFSTASTQLADMH